MRGMALGETEAVLRDSILLSVDTDDQIGRQRGKMGNRRQSAAIPMIGRMRAKIGG
jgi:hypothetical protein